MMHTSSRWCLESLTVVYLNLWPAQRDGWWGAIITILFLFDPSDTIATGPPGKPSNSCMLMVMAHVPDVNTDTRSRLGKLIRCLQVPPSNCMTATDKEGKHSQTYFQPISSVASIYREDLLVDEFVDFEQVLWSPCYPTEAHCATFVSYSKAKVSISWGFFPPKSGVFSRKCECNLSFF